MSGDGLSRLCRLVHVSLRHHKEVVELAEVTREKERELLISLSQVFRQIQGWTSEADSISLIVEQPDKNNECCTSFCQNHQCLTDIVATLISFLTVESKYVQHLVGNILIAVSKFITGAVCSMDANLKSFVDLLAICLEVAISNALLQSSVNQIEHSKYDPPGLGVLYVGLKNSNWRTVAEILRILRAITKAIEDEQENEDGVGSLEILLSSLSTCFAKLPWDALDASHTPGNIIAQVRSSGMNARFTESRILFLGSLVQLFSSLVEAVHEIEGSTTLQNKHSLIQRIEAIVPQLAEWCLAKEWNQHDSNILPYFQHKVLMLMSRLGSQVYMDCSSVQLRLQLLHKYYVDFLRKPISAIDNDQDNCLEGSPFLWSLSIRGNNHISSRHLQRQSIFLFLRLSICLIIYEESNGLLCSCCTVDSVSMFDSKTLERCIVRRKCILELYQWLQLHFPFNRVVDNEIYTKNFISFSSSFIKLYIHEDDLLFEVLLQMFKVATYTNKQTFKDENASIRADEDALAHISELFNPILLFHVFLAELQYDHQLLLDYLISKDSGTRCAEYLLKCLRKLCDSWKTFVELSLGLENDRKQMLKKQKISHEYGRDDDPQSERSGAKSLHFIKAKTCLLSLKNALEKLHKRSLFPYNPEVLLRRLKNFEELCDQ